MTSTFEDVVDGVSTSVAVKAPVRVATTANITLSGFQTIDGVTLTSSDANLRVLVKDQTDQTENGIYNAKSGAWERAKDFDNERDVRRGTVVRSNEGSTYASAWFEVTTSDPIEIGTSNIEFSTSTFPIDEEIKQVNGVSALRGVSPSAGSMYLRYHTSDGDHGHGFFRGVIGASAGTYTDNNGTIIVPTGGDGSSAWLRVYSGGVNIAWFGANPSAPESTNDTAISSALTVGRKVLIPFIDDGVYDVSSSFTLGLYGQTLEGEATGDGLGSTGDGVVLNVVSGFPTSGGDAAQSVLNLSDRYQHIKDVTIDCNSIALHGIYGTGGEVTHGSVEFVNVIEPTGDGLKFGDSVWMYNFTSVRVTTGAGYGFGMYGSSGLTTILFDNCYVSGSTTTGGWYLDTCAGVTMNSCACDASPGYALVLTGGSQVVVNGMNSEGTAKLFDMSDAVSTRQKLVVQGGRFLGYGDDSSPPSTLIDNGGSLVVQGAHFSTTKSYTAFLTTKSQSRTRWQENTIDLFDETNVIGGSSEIYTDRRSYQSNDSVEAQRHIVHGPSQPSVTFIEEDETSGTRIFELKSRGATVQLEALDESYAVTETLMRIGYGVSGRDTTLAIDGPYADDAAAGAGGVPIGRWYYRSTGAVHKRLT